MSKLSSFIRKLAGGKGLGRRALSWIPTDPNGGSWAELLSVSPTVIHTVPSPGFPLGAASTLGPILRRRPAHFLVMHSWTLEQRGQSERLARIAASYLRVHQKHQLIFLGNTARETELMGGKGYAAVTINQRCTTPAFPLGNAMNWPEKSTNSPLSISITVASIHLPSFTRSMLASP
jgi:hypothetical protein